MQELWEVVRRIPPGRVSSYGEVGRALRHPASGYVVGRWMASAPEGVPWWRVAAKDGRLPIQKRSPGMANEQQERLRAEGVAFLPDGRVDMARHGWAEWDSRLTNDD